MNNTGLALRAQERHAEALDAYRAAAVIFRATGRQHELALELQNLGNTYRSLGQLPEAAGAYAEAAGIFRVLGDLPREEALLADLAAARAALHEAAAGKLTP